MSEMPDLKPLMLAGLTWPQAKQQMRLTGCAVRRNHWCAPIVRLIDGRPALDDEGEIVEAEFLPTIEDARADDWSMTENPEAGMTKLEALSDLRSLSKEHSDLNGGGPGWAERNKAAWAKVDELFADEDEAAYERQQRGEWG
jgi:hypothetical protein